MGDQQSAIKVRIYDGDTPQNQRALIRREASILISNPDMLHTGILPHHTRWAKFFADLRWVVLDDDGSPRAEKHFILYTPPVVDPALGLRRAYTLETKEIAAQFIGDNIQTIVFGRARATVEVLLGYVRDAVEKFGVDPASVRGYRGGYLPGERREIERGLRDGSVRGVVATNALELGVDIGQLGAAVIAWYPGSIASVWQQAGRAGRRADTSAVVFVTSAAPLDQYVALHPKYIFESSPEHALINPDNLAILLNHI